MKKTFLLVLLASFASVVSLLVHIAIAEWLPVWIGGQMQGLQIQPSWDVRYLAGITSIEYGLATIALYYLTRKKLLKFGRFKASLVIFSLLAAINGALVRQPLMDFAVGNPLHVVLVQNSFKWLVWLIMSFIIVYGFEFINKKFNSE